MTQNIWSLKGVHIFTPHGYANILISCNLLVRRKSYHVELNPRWRSKMLRLAINQLNNFQDLTSSINFFSKRNANQSSKHGHQMIEEVVENYFSLLTTSNYKKLNSFYAPAFIKAKSTQTQSNGQQKAQNLNGLYAILQGERVQSYEVLTQYKLPFGRMGVDRYLTYTKLTTHRGIRYMALWIGRNLNSKQSWKIYDIYFHTATPNLSLNVESDPKQDHKFSTLMGKAIDDSTITSLFFTRLFTDRAQSKKVYKLLGQIKGCQKEVIDTIKTQANELLNILSDVPTTHSLNILSRNLRDKVKSFQASVINESSYSSNPELKLLSVSLLPTSSQKQTRVLAHFYIPGTKRYLSVWFNRSLTGDFSWKIDDFYIHRFTQVDRVAYVNEEYCQQTFQTGKSRTFYAADLMGKYIIGQKAGA